MEAWMSYQHCPSCRLTVHLDGPEAADGPCPRCGAGLGDEPRSLFVEPLAGGRLVRARSTLTPPRARSTLTPDAVRTAMAGRRGRFRRDGTSLSGGS
jgi:hypothetical protein